ncbi:molecular chaperone DjlA [Halorhodospira abdelmalekii]|uniref:co-chaperone DjlA n=1 Tax=Halorhodospira abdelmalekii TaxID=421629 RepID=UPI001902E0FA|nr:co-chaperone DjlA [Halorhodospira abdelmalekii]MBK1734145.1 molecular chaperone DjlA [Halorhodospira abdelmalekii]
MQPYRIVERWLGRLLGALGGGLIAAPLGVAVPFGVLSGFLLGFGLDQWVRVTQSVGLVWSGCGLNAAQRVYIGATALVMGYVAKYDGRVSEAEVAAARRVLNELPLDECGRKRAIVVFNRGKDPAAPLRVVLWLLRWVGRSRPEELARFLDFQLRVAAADGLPDAARERLLRWIWRQAGVSVVDLDARLDGLRRGKLNRTVRPTIDHAYRLLGVGRNASPEQVRKAYRRAISRSHPDRLVGRGLSEQEIEAAGERTRQIRAAYEAIREVRGM